MNTVLNLLIQARDRIKDPKDWTKDYYAKRADGENTDSEATDAVCWCTTGSLNWAIAKSSAPFNRDPLTAAVGLLSAYAFTKGFTNCVYLNDAPDTTHAQVMDMFDKAITEASRL